MQPFNLLCREQSLTLICVFHISEESCGKPTRKNCAKEQWEKEGVPGPHPTTTKVINDTNANAAVPKGMQVRGQLVEIYVQDKDQQTNLRRRDSPVTTAIGRNSCDSCRRKYSLINHL